MPGFTIGVRRVYNQGMSNRATATGRHTHQLRTPDLHVSDPVAVIP